MISGGVIVALIGAVVFGAILVKKKGVPKVLQAKQSGLVIGPVINGMNLSEGMPARPTAQNAGWYFDFPGPGGKVDYVQDFSPPPLVGATALGIRYAVTGGGFLAPQADGEAPGRVGICIQRKNDNWSGSGKYQQYRLYGTARPLLVEGGGQQLTVTDWTDVDGKPVTRDVVADVFADLDNWAVVFGGSFAGHGVYATQPSRFTLLGPLDIQR